MNKQTDRYECRRTLMKRKYQHIQKRAPSPYSYTFINVTSFILESKHILL